MMRKSILFIEKNTARLIEEEMQKPGEHDVVVQIAVSTISSGTERANLTGEKNVTTIPGQIVNFPRRCGYSSSGIVKSVGSAVKSVAPGDRVAVSWSSHSQYVCVNEKNIHKINSDKTSFSEAALWHISTFPMAAIRKCRLEIGESAIVMGLGVLGLMEIMLLKAAGAVPIIAADPIAKKREEALKLGADYALDPLKPDFAQEVKKLTGGINVAIEVTGNGKALDTVLDCMAPFGRVALLGCTRHSDFTIDYYKKVHAPGISLIGAHTKARPEYESSPGLWTTHDDVCAVQRLVDYGRLSLETLVEEVHSPAEAETVYQRLAQESSFPVVQFDWRKL